MKDRKRRLARIPPQQLRQPRQRRHGFCPASTIGRRSLKDDRQVDRRHDEYCLSDKTHPRYGLFTQGSPAGLSGALYVDESTSWGAE